MQRIRTIKPEFFKHDELYDAELQVDLPLRLAYVGLWTCCDREGRFKWKPRQLKASILPYDEVDFSDVLDALEIHGFVRSYEHDGEKYGEVPTFKEHQCVNTREAKSNLPEPPEYDNAMHVRARARIAQEFRGKNVTKTVRQTIYARDGHQCVRCDATEDLTIDHIFPQSMGGTHFPSNLRTLCRPCNSARPVAGQALIDDLASDGLTLNDMQRTCMHVHAQGEGKGREGKGKEGNSASSPSAGRVVSIQPKQSNPLNAETWTAYESAYQQRYAVAPVRNAKTNSQVVQLVKRLGQNAPLVAGWFVSHNKGWYVQKSHSLDCLVADAEGLYTQWATNHQVTESQARSADRMGNAGRRLDSLVFDDSEPF
jgi:5-methylcytosine-specific restriction endonuclease McrA